MVICRLKKTLTQLAMNRHRGSYNGIGLFISL